MLAPSTACFAQGFLLNVGDLTSGFFVMAIALHTFYTAVKGRRIEHNPFLATIVCIWAFALMLSMIGPLQSVYTPIHHLGLLLMFIRHGNHYFVKAGAWCWAGPDYEEDRLALHYIWIFIVQFGTIIIYIAVLLHLKAAMKAIVPTLRDQSDTFAKVDRAAKLMVLYPFFYIVLTLPLSAGRMWSLAHHADQLPDAYQCVAGGLIASSGFVDALLYTLTRKTLLSGGSSRPLHSNRVDGGKGSDKSGNPELSLSDLGPGGITQTRTVTVTANAYNLPSDDDDDDERGRKASKTAAYHNFERSSHSPTGSLDPIIGITGVPERATTKVVKFATEVTATAIDDGSDDGKSVESSVENGAGANGRTIFRDYAR